MKPILTALTNHVGLHQSHLALMPTLLGQENISWRWQHQQELDNPESVAVRGGTDLNEMDIDRRLNELQVCTLILWAEMKC